MTCDALTHRRIQNVKIRFSVQFRTSYQIFLNNAQFFFNFGNVIPNVAEILIEKHRAGPTGLVKLYFKGECTKFVNLNEENNEPEGENMPQAQTGDLPFENIPLPEEPADFGAETNVDSEIF